MTIWDVAAYLLKVRTRAESEQLHVDSIEPETNGFGQYHAVTRKLFHAKSAYFRQLNAKAQEAKYRIWAVLLNKSSKLHISAHCCLSFVQSVQEASVKIVYQ